jgi:anti-sigma regulatory factor (Ser/Thr protein kinase)
VVTSIELPPERSAAARARHFARDVCLEWGLFGEVVDDVELLVSELVTNAVLHARSRARLTIEERGSRLRVSVADESATEPRLRDYGPESVTGRGILLVDRLSEQWGVEHDDGDGKRVWFEVGLSESSQGLRA